MTKDRKTIKHEDLPAILTPEVIDLLVEMMSESPQSSEWHELSTKLSSEQFWQIVHAKESKEKSGAENAGLRADDRNVEDDLYRTGAIHLARDHYFNTIFDEYELVNNKLVSLEMIKENARLAGIFEKIEFRRSYMTENERYTYFSSSESIFAQCYPVEIIIDGLAFTSSLHYVEYAKSIQFCDSDSTNDILAAKDQDRIYELGKSVKFFTEIAWHMVLGEVLHRSIKEKFLQHEHLKKALLSTRGTTIVLASAYDKKWGIGVSAESSEAKRRKLWPGKNLLGELLTFIRYELSYAY